jgi:uncharacterized damage-inducible protein DinB
MSAALKQIAYADLEREIATTRKVLGRVPTEHFSFQPHEKSMNLGRLAMHVATLLQWAVDTITQDGLDLDTAKGPRTDVKDTTDLLAEFEKHASRCKEELAKLDEAALLATWSLKKGGATIYSASRAYVLRVWCLNHLVHHRAQVCVYLRLLNVPVPAVYFNSADEPEWIFE